MCGTCRYCLGTFQASGVLSFVLFLVSLSVFSLYGGMPPTFYFVIGFWMLIIVAWLSIYLTLIVVRILGKGMFTKWMPRFCFTLIIVVIALYAGVTLCFFIKVTPGKMISYSRAYSKWHAKKNDSNKDKSGIPPVPPFLLKLQEQYRCCGINDYKDYNNPKIFGPENLLTRQLVVDASDPIDPTKSEYYENQETVFKEHDQKSRRIGEKIQPRFRDQLYFNVPKSCCEHTRRYQFAQCGMYVEFTAEEYQQPDPIKYHPFAKVIVNNVDSGCFKIYEYLMKETQFQLSWLVIILQYGSLLQCFVHFSLLWVFRLSLRTMHRNLKGEIVTDNEEIEMEAGPAVSSAFRRGGNSKVGSLPVSRKPSKMQAQASGSKAY